MSPLDRILAARPFVLLDGGLATELEASGCDLDDPLWSARVLIDEPERVAAAHRAYFEAGADCGISATYQATYQGLARRGLDHDAATAVMLRSLDLVRNAASAAGKPDGLAVGSAGSYGAYLADGSEYRGDYGKSVAELAAFHRPRLALLAGAADLVACETVPCLIEAQALAEVLGDLPNARAWVSFSCRDAHTVWAGDTIEACVAAVASVTAVVAVGINCVNPSLALALIRRIGATTDKPIVAYPNSGERYADGTWDGAGTAPAAFAQLAQTWLAAGARLIGGCCRTTPAHIEALARLRG